MYVVIASLEDCVEIKVIDVEWETSLIHLSFCASAQLQALLTKACCHR